MTEKPEIDLGRVWRLLAHRGGEKVELENQGLFDELVVGDWLHVEQMDEAVWWLQVGDARLIVTLRAGSPPTVDIERGFYAEPRGATTTL